MQHFRSSLTRLSSLMKDKLPEGPDIYGYSGITRSLLIGSIETAYRMSQEIKDTDPSNFEVISLKRAGSKLYKVLKEYLETNKLTQDQNRGFDKFLTDLSTLTEKTMMTYFIVTKEGVRSDDELATIKSQIADMEKVSDELTDKQVDIKEREETISATLDTITSHADNTKLQAADVKRWHEDIEERYLKMKTTSELIVGWDTNIKGFMETSDNSASQILEKELEAKSKCDLINGYAEKGEKYTAELKSSNKLHDALLTEIKNTLEAANRSGMAGSFVARKNELRLSQTVWGGVFVYCSPLVTRRS